MKAVIQVEGLSKKYQIKHQAGGALYKTLRETITHLPKRLFSRSPKESREEFWALNDVSFNIMPGERVGIIGRNGAGKSTLLKLLSRITEPTKGRITLRGRVASLLEVGTGFHPELTGRENIFLNGAILGMHRSEIQRKFDEIVDFSGVEKFLDTPVKRYSSGMYVRLAFAVAAHLEPEILIVDEVLAVGDAEFQKKCMGKMEEVSQGQGRTVLLVSHNMNHILALCPGALFLGNGQVIFQGMAEDVIKEYKQAQRALSNESSKISRMPVGRHPFMTELELSCSENTSLQFCTSNSELTLRCQILAQEIDANKEYQALWFLKADDGSVLSVSASSAMHGVSLNKNTMEVTCKLKLSPLPVGNYYFRVLLHVPGMDNFDDVDNILPFSVVQSTCGSGLFNSSLAYGAKFYVPNTWEITKHVTPRI